VTKDEIVFNKIWGLQHSFALSFYLFPKKKTMQPTSALRAAHKPLIRFLGPRAQLWKGIYKQKWNSLGQSCFIYTA
jgi:hypothetical protein